MTRAITAEDLADYWDFSQRTFGPGERTKGVIDHIRKELEEILADPTDTVEWIDVVFLAIDGALRHGATPEQVIETYHAKKAINMARIWTDWRTASPDEAITHVKGDSPSEHRNT